MNKFKKIISNAIDSLSFTLLFIVGLWLALVPVGFLIFFHVRAWRGTDPELRNFERFNEMIRSTFWETLAVVALAIVLNKIVRLTIKIAEEMESDDDD